MSKTTIPFLPIPRTMSDGTHYNYPPLRDSTALDLNPDRPFPIECLPYTVRALVSALAKQERTKESLPACCALGVLSASLGRGVSVQSGPNQFSRANLFVLVGSESGTGKSRIYGQIASPFVQQDRALLETWESYIRPTLETEESILQSTLKGLESELKKSVGGSGVRQSMIDARARLNAVKAEKEREPRLFVADVTSQKLPILLKNESESLAVMSPDARDVVDNLLGRYHEKQSPDADVFLKAWSGDEIRVDRIGRPSVTLNDPCLSALWLVQPDKVAALFSEKALTEGGLLPRFLLCQTNAELVRKDRTAAAPAHTLQRWEALVKSLTSIFRLQRNPVSIDFTQPAQIPTPPVVNPTAAAEELFDSYHNEIIDGRNGGTYTDVGGFSARWAEQAWRIALLLHVVECWEARGDAVTRVTLASDNLCGRVAATPLSAEIAERAIKIVRWFAEQQLVLLDTERRAQRAARLSKLDALLAKSPGGVAARDLISNRIASDSAQAHALLEQLCSEGQLIRSERTSPRGGYPVRLYHRVGSDCEPLPLAA